MPKKGRRCSICGQIKSLDQFTFIKPSGNRPKGRYSSSCKPCRNEQEKDWIKNNPKRARMRWRRHYIKNREMILERAALQREKLKQKCFDSYGWECACCGEDDPHFLTLDHIIPPKSKTDYEKKTLYRYLVSHNFPEGIQTLCWNCNMAKSIYKSCPHQWEKKK